MKIYAIWNCCGPEYEPHCYVEAKDIDNLKKIMAEREHFGMFPGWSPVEISKKEMKEILNRLSENEKKDRLFKLKYSVNLKELEEEPDIDDGETKKKELQRKLRITNFIFREITSSFIGGGEDIFQSETVMNFFEDDKPQIKSESEKDFEVSLFTNQLWNDFITAQENILRKDKENVDFGDLDFFEASCINYYTSHYSASDKVLNDFKDSPSLMTPVMRAYFSVLKTGLDKIEPLRKKTPLYRFVKLNSGTLSEYESGSQHVLPAFCSFTTQDTLSKFSDKNVKFVIENDGESFKPVGHLSEYGQQQECLACPPMAVEVLKREKEGGFDVIHIKIIKL